MNGLVNANGSDDRWFTAKALLLLFMLEDNLILYDENRIIKMACCTHVEF
jgi:hypothetical protein